MGKALINEIALYEDCTLSGGTVRKDSDFAAMDLGTLAGLEPLNIKATTDTAALLKNSDAVIDFTTPENSLKTAEISAKQGKIAVLGTTGFTDAQKKELTAYAKKTPIIWSANMSIGVNLLQGLVQKVASLLDDSYDIEIVEMHHCRKVDAPSGTALALGEAAARGRGMKLKDVACKARDGMIGPRPRGEIGFATLRGGDVIGEHTVIFAGDGERIELSHKASSRQIFAKGAVRAALWAKGKPSGFYTMQDVLSV